MQRKAADDKAVAADAKAVAADTKADGAVAAKQQMPKRVCRYKADGKVATRCSRC